MNKHKKLYTLCLFIALSTLVLTTGCDRTSGETERQKGQAVQADEAERPDKHEHTAEHGSAEKHTTNNKAGSKHENPKHASHGDDMGDMAHVLGEGEYESSEVVRQPGAKVGEVAQCPVSGEVFSVTDKHSYFDLEAGRVYFCCPKCIRRFQREPEKWLATQDIAR